MYNFVKESNRIEGIHRDPTPMEIEAHEEFVKGDLTIEALIKLVSVLAPGHKPRFTQGMNVYVGSHTPPSGGPLIERQLGDLITEINNQNITPFEAHCFYEWLHPFTDGNGRSGRALWLWIMGRRALNFGFLHNFYYQTLEHMDGNYE